MAFDRVQATLLDDDARTDEQLRSTSLRQPARSAGGVECRQGLHRSRRASREAGEISS